MENVKYRAAASMGNCFKLYEVSPYDGYESLLAVVRTEQIAIRIISNFHNYDSDWIIETAYIPDAF